MSLLTPLGPKSPAGMVHLFKNISWSEKLRGMFYTERMDFAHFTLKDWTNIGMLFAFLYFFIKSIVDWEKAEPIQGKIIGYKYLRYPKKKFYDLYDKFLFVPLVEYSEVGKKNLVSELYETSLIKPEGTALKFHAIKKSNTLRAYQYRNFFIGLTGLVVWPVLITAAYDLYNLVGITERLAITISLCFPILVLLSRYFGDFRIFGISNQWLLDFSGKRQDSFINKDERWVDGQSVSYKEICQTMHKNKLEWRLETILNFLTFTLFALLSVASVVFAFMYYFDLSF